jgi:integrase
VRSGPRGGQKETTRTFPTLVEAVAWVTHARAALDAGEPIEVARVVAPRFGDLAVSWSHRAESGAALTRSRKPYAAATIASYRIGLEVHALGFTEPRHGVPIEDLPGDRVDGRCLQNLADHLTTTRSAGTARQAVAAVVAVLRDAYGRGLIDSLPGRIILPPPPPSRAKHLTAVDLDRVQAGADDDDARLGRSLLGPLVALLVGTGCRVGEALALTWGPLGVDLEHDPPIIVIGRSTTKTDAGARAVPIDGPTAVALHRHRAETGQPPDGAYVFTRPAVGGPLRRDGIVRAGLDRIYVAAGIDAKGAHVLRHSHATILASMGAPAPALAARLGHRDAGFTMRTYVKPTATDLAALPAAFDEARRKARER